MSEHMAAADQESPRPDAGTSAVGSTTASSTPAVPAAADAAPPAEPAEPPVDVVSPDQVKAVLRRVKDPELNLNIVDLGLVYGVGVEGSTVRVDMSLTSPGCPSGPEIMGEAERQLRSMPGVTDVAMNLVWSPPWTPERIEPRVRAYLGF
jgi:metal-sulfur cluster biosynthetic enzyme